MNARTKIVAAEAARYPISRRSIPWAELLPGCVILADAALILLSAILSYAFLVDASSYVVDFYLFATGFVLLVAVLLFRSGGMYRPHAILSVWHSLDTIIVSILSAFVFLLTILHALKTWPLYQTDWLLAFGLSSVCCIVLARGCIGVAVSHSLQKGTIGRRTAVLGTGDYVDGFLTRLSERKTSFTAVTAVFDPSCKFGGRVAGNYPVAGDLQDLLCAARARSFDDIVIALPDSAAEQRAEAIDVLRELPVDVYLAPHLTEFGVRLRPMQLDENVPLFEVWQRPISGWSRIMKLVQDVALAGLALVLLLPALLVIAVAIRMDSSGPVLFRQKRLGFNNEVFEIFKFRTMYESAGADKRVRQATRSDARITRVGWFLRRTSLDELPQLLNVLNGTMSLVGPRPHALSHNADFSQAVRGYFGRHKVKPGITGWAQVNGLRGEIDSHEKLVARINHDVHYAENWSLLFDLRILLVTCCVVLFQRNAY